MNNAENPTPVQPDANDVKLEVESLRQVIVSVLVLLVVVSGTLNLYFWRQFRNTKAELNVMRPQAPQMAAEIAGMQDLLRKAIEYGRTHPDFMPILAKYNLKPAGTTGAPPASAASPAALPPSAAAPAAPKKK